jgi:hypothetical protein
MTLEDEILFAKAAYKAYGKTTGNKNYQGLEMPTWDNLTPTIRSAWINAAQEVINHVSLTGSWPFITAESVKISYHE